MPQSVIFTRKPQLYLIVGQEITFNASAFHNHDFCHKESSQPLQVFCLSVDLLCWTKEQWQKKL